MERRNPRRRPAGGGGGPVDASCDLHSEPGCGQREVHLLRCSLLAVPPLLLPTPPSLFPGLVSPE